LIYQALRKPRLPSWLKARGDTLDFVKVLVKQKYQGEYTEKVCYQVLNKGLAHQNFTVPFQEANLEALVLPGRKAGEKHPEVVGAEPLEPAVLPGRSLHQNLHLLSYLTLIKSSFFGLSQLPQTPCPQTDFLTGQQGKFGCRGAGPGGERKNMEVGRG
jgi:hypothetical protein